MLQRLHGQRYRLPHHQPLLDERPNKRVTARILQQPVHLSIQHFRLAQLARLGQLPQLGIGWRAGQHETQPRGHRVLRGRGRFQIPERRTHQHGMKRRTQRVIKPRPLAAHLFVQLKERLAFAATHRPAPRAFHPQREQSFCARVVVPNLANLCVPFRRRPGRHVIHFRLNRLQRDKRCGGFLGWQSLFTIP